MSTAGYATASDAHANAPATTPATTVAETVDSTAPLDTAADSAEWDGIVEAASGQSILVYHIAAPAQFDTFVSTFNEKYPDITVTGERGSRDLLERVDAELSTGTQGADILIFNDAQWFEDRIDGFSELRGPNLAGFPEPGVQVPRKIMMISIIPYSTIIWNTNEFPDGFSSYEDVLNAPAGRVGVLRPGGGTGCLFYRDYLPANYGADYLERLGALDPIEYTSSTQTAQAVAAQEVGVTLSGQPALAIELQEAGAPVEYKFVSAPGVGAPVWAGAISQSASPEATQVFMDYLLAEEGQAAWNADVAVSLVPGIAGAGSPDELSWYDPITYPNDVVETCSEEVNSVVFG